MGGVVTLSLIIEDNPGVVAVFLIIETLGRVRTIGVWCDLVDRNEGGLDDGRNREVCVVSRTCSCRDFSTVREAVIVGVSENWICSSVIKSTLWRYTCCVALKYLI